MRSRWTFLVGAVLVIQALAVGFVSGGERVPAAPDLAAFSNTIGDWHKVREDVLAEGVVKNLGADARITSTYLDRRTGLYADLLVAWFQSQRGGSVQPHSPKGYILKPPAGVATGIGRNDLELPGTRYCRESLRPGRQ